MGRVGGEAGCFVFLRVACVVFCGCSCSADKVVAEPFEGSAMISIVFTVSVVVVAGSVGGKSGGGR